MPETDLAPIPGNPGDVAAAGRTLASIAADVASNARALRSLATSDSSWTGSAASRARARSATLPGKLDKVQRSYADAGRALTIYATALAAAQDQCRTAIAAAERASTNLDAARSAQATAAAVDAAQSRVAAAAGTPSPPATAQRYQATIDDATARLARARAVHDSALQQQEQAARTTATALRNASREGIPNQSWWHQVTQAAAHWAASQWTTAVRQISKVAATVSAIAGIAALVLSVAGVVFPPLEVAAAVLESISLVSAVIGTVADATLAGTGHGSWSAIGWDALSFAPSVASRVVRRGARFLRSPKTVVHASEEVKSGSAATAAATDDAKPRAKLLSYAGSFRPPSRWGPLTVGLLETSDGTTYLGRSGFSGSLHSELRAALDEVPEDVRMPYHGRCAEIDCINQALKSGEVVKGASVWTARVRSLDSPSHGTPIPPCGSCAAVLEAFGGHYKP